MGEDYSVMRTTLLSNMLDTFYKNISKKQNDLRFYEIGTAFIKDGADLPEEKQYLTMGLYGDYSFYDLKDFFIKAMGKTGFYGFRFETEEHIKTFHPGRCAKIVYNNIYIGTFGELHPDVIENYNLTQRVYLGEIDLDLVYDNSDRTIIYNPLPKYPSTSRDIALLVKKDVYVGQIEEIIEANGQGLVESYKLFDVYTGSQIADGYKSVAYSITYRSKDKTLTDEDVAKVHDKILSELETKLDAKLRTN